MDLRFLDLGTSWGCGQLHAPTDLFPGKEPPVPIGEEAGWAPEPVWTTRRKYLTLPGIELQPLRRPARSQSLYRQIIILTYK
jgi:hypothetical protein